MENTLQPITNETFDYNQILGILGQASQLTQRNAESTAVIMERMSRTESLLGGVSTKINSMDGTLTTMVDEVNTLKLSEEITTFQNENITTAVKRRIFEILGDDPYEMKKYSKIFFLRLYSDARKNANMGSKVSRTKKRDYQRVLDYVEAWYPTGGCTSLKIKADLNADARKMAKENGYN